MEEEQIWREHGKYSWDLETTSKVPEEEKYKAYWRKVFGVSWRVGRISYEWQKI